MTPGLLERRSPAPNASLPVFHVIDGKSGEVSHANDDRFPLSSPVSECDRIAKSFHRRNTVFPTPPCRARKDVGGARFDAQRNAPPSPFTLRLSQAKRASRGQRKTHNIAEHRAILVPADGRSRRIFSDQRLLQLRQGKARCLLDTSHYQDRLQKLQCPIVKSRFLHRTKSLSKWCGREDLNLHTLTGTCTSSMRVCQFRHDRKTQSRVPTSSHTYLKLVRLPKH